MTHQLVRVLKLEIFLIQAYFMKTLVGLKVGTFVPKLPART